MFVAVLILNLLCITGEVFAQQGPLQVLVAPASSGVPKGATLQMSAKFFFLGARAAAGGARPVSVKWFSSNPVAASIDPTSGLVSAHQIGTVKITAVSGPFRGSTVLTVDPPALVSIPVTPAS